METTLIGGPPEPRNLLKLAKGQISFISMFAIPLFEEVSDVLPELASAPKQIRLNCSIWQERADFANELKESNELEGNVDFDTTPSQSLPVEDESAEPTPTGTVNSQLHTPSPQDALGEGSAVEFPIQNTLDQAPDVRSERPSPESKRPPESEFYFFDSTTIRQQITGSVGGTTLGSLDHTPQNSAEIKFGICQTPETVLDVQSISSANRRSSGSVHGSLPSTSCGTGRDTRAQSSSTGTNTVVTPLSPATNATSFAVGDSGDERDLFRSKGSYFTEDEYHSRPASSNPYTLINGSEYPAKPLQSNPTCLQVPHYIENVGKGRSHRVMTTLLGNRSSSSRGSSPVRDEISKSGNQSPLGSEVCASKTVSRRKSRLRLTFWKRRNSTS